MNKKGSLLFETFVALLILSIGITSMLRVFGESLFVGKRSEDQNYTEEKMKHILFQWFVYPGGVKLPDAGTVTFLLDAGDAGELTCIIESKKIPVSDEITSEKKQIQSSQEGQYFDVRAVAQKNAKVNLLDMETVIFQSKKSAA